MTNQIYFQIYVIKTKIVCMNLQKFQWQNLNKCQLEAVTGVFCKKGVLKNLANFLGIYVSWSFFQHRCFPVKFAKFLRTAILKNICERLLLVK